jgi:cell division protein FtsN
VPRDYKSRATAIARHPTPGWVVFLAGLIVGVFGSGLAWLKLSPPPGRPQLPVPDTARKAPEKPNRKDNGPKPRFDFYTLLPAQEVVVDEADINKPEPAAPPSTPAPQRGTRPAAAAPTASGVTAAARTPAKAESYVLQMGAYQRRSDAERLKASLALLGVEARIQRVSIDDKESLQRVRSGPYGRSQVNELHARLKANGIAAMIIKLSD